MKSAPVIREIASADIEAVTAIQAEAVLNGLANFGLVPLNTHQMKEKMEALVGDHFPYIVAEIDAQIAGFAYVSPFRPRPGYRWTVEDSVYVSPDFQGNGLGSKLLGEIIRQSEQLGFRQMVAMIGDSNNHASIELHRKHGFHMTGTLHDVGYKKEKWLDVVIMQLELGTGASSQPDETVYPGTLYKSR